MPGPTASGVSFPVAPYGHLKIGARTLAKIAQNGKTPPPVPSFMFRLKQDPILCFQSLAHVFNRTMFRLKRMKIEPKNEAQTTPKPLRRWNISRPPQSRLATNVLV
jgi:hypothetical protein